MNPKRAERLLTDIYEKILNKIPEIKQGTTILEEAQITPRHTYVPAQKMIFVAAHLFDKTVYRIFHPASPPDKETLEYFVDLLSWTRAMLHTFGSDTQRQVIMNLADDLDDIAHALRYTKIDHPQEIEAFLVTLQRGRSNGQLSSDRYTHIKEYIDQHFSGPTFSPEAKAHWTKFNLEFEPLLKPEAKHQLGHRIDSLNIAL